MKLHFPNHLLDVVLFVILVGFAGAALAERDDCPDTHYPCGSDSCCSK